MDYNANHNLPAWILALIGCALVVSGLLGITRGIQQYEVWGIVAGVGLCLLPFYLYALPVRGGRHKKRTLGYRLAATTGFVALVLELAGFVVPVSGINPIMWFARSSHVTPSTLVRHPFVYNHQQVETAGYLSTNDRGWCTLEVGGSDGAAESRRPAAVIVLASRGLTCKPDSTQRAWVTLSGTFEVFRTSGDFDIPYALTNVQGIPAALRDTGNGS